MKKIASAVVVLSLFAILFTACGNSDGGKGGDNALVGTWRMDSVEMAGQTISLDDPDMAAYGFDQLDYSFTFKDNGKVVMSVMGIDAEADYTLEGTTVTVSAEGESVNLTFEKDVLSMTDPSMGGAKVVFKKA